MGNAVVGDLEDRRVAVGVDRHDRLAAAHPRQVLDRPADPAGDVQLRRDGLAGQADLSGVRLVAGVAGSPRGADGGIQLARQIVDDLEVLLVLQRPAARDNDVGFGDVFDLAAGPGDLGRFHAVVARSGLERERSYFYLLVIKVNF